MNIKGLSIKQPAHGIYKWRGFTLQKGAIFGTLHLDGIKTAFVYMGQKRREIRPDGTKAGWLMKLYLCPLEDGIFYTKDREPADEFGWSTEYVRVSEKPEYRAIFSKNPHVEYYREPECATSGPRSLLAYVPKQKNLGHIYNMVRERQ